MTNVSARPTVLVVDDVETNLVAMAAALAADGVDLRTACSGRDALEILLLHDVAVALVDVQMPDIDGFELAELMRGTERTRLVPIIFVTGSARDEQRLFRGYDAGAVDYLYKPVEPTILRNKVQVFLDLWTQRQQILETLRLNEMFTAVLSHDLRNPLSAIASGAALLDAQPTAEMAKLVSASLRNSTAQMSAMVRDLLDLTRARLADGIPVDPRPDDLDRVCVAACEQQRLSTPQVSVDYTPVGRLDGRFDADRLAQALGNLLTNAAQHSDGAHVQVRADGTDADTVRVTVWNAGAIPPEALARVFDPFWRNGSSRSGLGLGLFIVREIVRAHAGEVLVESGSGQGTSFELRLPRFGPGIPARGGPLGPASAMGPLGPAADPPPPRKGIVQGREKSPHGSAEPAARAVDHRAAHAGVRPVKPG